MKLLTKKQSVKVYFFSFTVDPYDNEQGKLWIGLVSVRSCDLALVYTYKENTQSQHHTHKYHMLPHAHIIIT